MANLTNKQKQLNIESDNKGAPTDLKYTQPQQSGTKEQRIREKLSKLVELMVQSELKEYKKKADLNEIESDKGNLSQISEIFDDFYIVIDNLIAQHYGTSDMNKFREMFDLLFLKYQEKINNILK